MNIIVYIVTSNKSDMNYFQYKLNYKRIVIYCYICKVVSIDVVGTFHLLLKMNYFLF